MDKKRRRASFNSNVNTARINNKEGEEESMFSARNISKKTADNLARIEASTDEQPLRTEKTDELKQKELEDEEDMDEEYEIEVDTEDDELESDEE